MRERRRHIHRTATPGPISVMSARTLSGRHRAPAGRAVGAAELGVLASLAVAHPLVHRRPRVAIIGSGDEIVDVDQPEEILSGRKIASSNTHTLIALVRLAGGEPVNLGVARDTRESFREHLAAARRPTCWSPPPASAWASTTTCVRCWKKWARPRSSGTADAAWCAGGVPGSLAKSRGSVSPGIP